MEPNFELPDDISPTGPWRSAPPMTDDPALPALEILRDTGLADAFPELRLGDIPPDLRLCNYVPGSRATFEIRAEDRRFAVKMYVRSLFHRPVALDPAKPGDVVSPGPESSGDRRD